MARRKYASTLRDLAVELKRDVGTVHRWGKAGAPCTARDRTDRGYLIKTVAEWAEERGLLNGKPMVSEPVDSASRTSQQRFMDARAKEREEKARLVEIQRLQLEGELMPVAEHREHMVKTHRFFRAELETFVRRMPPRLAGRTTIEITNLLRDEVESMMRIWSEGGVYSNERAD